MRTGSKSWLGAGTFVALAMAIAGMAVMSPEGTAEAGKSKDKGASATPAKPLPPPPAPTAAPAPKLEADEKYTQKPGPGCQSAFTDEKGNGRACGTSEACCVHTTKEMGYVRNQDSCVDLKTDRTNCGGCGRECPKGESCINGLCGHQQGAIQCDGQWVDALNNVSNCGACGHKCPVFCEKGQCVSCGKGETFCGNRCSNLKNSHIDCGQCDHTCPDNWVCSKGHCEP
jgi:hypothetical protein